MEDFKQFRCGLSSTVDIRLVLLVKLRSKEVEQQIGQSVISAASPACNAILS